jgi:DNA polymerase elongation subunit (family B)
MGLYIQVQEQMRSGQIELEKYVITKSLTKAPEDYPDAKNQPHVQASVAYLLSLLILICWETLRTYYLTTV